MIRAKGGQGGSIGFPYPSTYSSTQRPLPHRNNRRRTPKYTGELTLYNKKITHQRHSESAGEQLSHSGQV